MPLELFLDLLSSPCRSVYMFAKTNNIPFDFKKISLMEGENHSEEYRKVNAMKTVPALRDGDFCMAESVAMMMYMAEKYKTPDHWYPVDLQKRARMNEYLSWQHMALRAHGSKMFYIKVMVPKVMGKEVPKEKKDAAVEDLEGSIKLLVEKFLQDRPFLAGDQISLADLVAIVDVYQPVALGIDVFKGRPKLGAWRDRVRQEIGPELFDETLKGAMAVPEMIKMADDAKMQAFRPRLQIMFF